MKKAIFRIQKLKSSRSVSGCLKHNFRDIDTPNANIDLKNQNEVLAGPKTSAEAMQNYSDNLPAKIRKNAVMAIECLSTASPEFFETASQETQKQFFADSLKFIEDKFGKENIVSAVIHRDESTPHLQTLVIPLKDEKLNAKSFVGGSKHELSKMQTEYHQKVAKYGLTRGQLKSKSTHNTIKSFYSDVEETKKRINGHIKKQETEINYLKQVVRKKEQLVKKVVNDFGDLQNENESLLLKIKDLMSEVKTNIYKAFGRDIDGKRERERERGRSRGRDCSSNQSAGRETKHEAKHARHRDFR